MKNILQSIVNNWQLDAVQEDIDKYFYSYEEVESILNGRKYYVIGRKGSGKTAISQHILKKKAFDIFSESLSFKNFPFNDLYSHEDNNYRHPNQYITFWKYIIYIYVCKMMVANETTDVDFRNAIRDILPAADSTRLSREIRRWTGVEFGAQLSEKIGSFHLKLDSSHYENKTTWVERVNILEDLILNYCDKSQYFIVFDELDEDYSDADKDDNVYICLLKGLFKAVQNVRSVFKNAEMNIKPVIFLRDDIYAQIKDSDKNKWSDFKVDLSWTPDKLKKLIAYRISKESDIIGNSFEHAWNTIFQRDLTIFFGGNKKKSIPVFDYILLNTHLRPRDLISFIKCCCKTAIAHDRSYVGWKDVKDADREFSNYFRDELNDEISPLIPDIDEVWNLITEMRKPIFSSSEFENMYSEYKNRGYFKDNTCSQILETLFNFSILGNQHKTQNKWFFFKYQQTNMTYNHFENLVVHRGLLKSLQLL